MIQQFVFLFKIINGTVDDPNLLGKINFYAPTACPRKPPTFKVKIAKTNY